MNPNNNKKYKIVPSNKIKSKKPNKNRNYKKEKKNKIL